MNMDTAEIRNKAKILYKARMKRLANSLRKWATSLDTGQHEFQQFSSSWTKDDPYRLSMQHCSRALRKQ